MLILSINSVRFRDLNILSLKFLCILMYAASVRKTYNYFHSYYVYERNSFIIIFGCKISYLKII